MKITNTIEFMSQCYSLESPHQGVDPDEKPKPGDGDEAVSTENEEEEEGDIRPIT